MRGHVAGVQTIMREMYMAKAVYVHCWTHRLHLVVIDVCRVVPFVDDFFSLVSKLYTYFNKSGVTNKYFRNAQEYLGLGKFERILFHSSQIKGIKIKTTSLCYSSGISLMQTYPRVSS